jgi:hypothetical protein
MIEFYREIHYPGRLIGRPKNSCIFANWNWRTVANFPRNARFGYPAAPFGGEEQGFFGNHSGHQLKQLMGSWTSFRCSEKNFWRKRLPAARIGFFLKPVIVRCWCRLEDFFGKKVRGGLHFAPGKLV